ncbi:hypothetical protein TVAG_090160 [Trichomonas vaginalis G3]|uniref:Ubiquitin-like domain-containing protein n=1 Tax=Trichomonas vaginalis (strain ATCC PRA-98 / G3) TaxID=412133 RepID=A2EZP3_TRIV3|nr:ubiquitin-like family [Trichomonas vaginalis G3]EAY01881.1 hypothetical protein TVAG_090160 [Trichomonas vaginalis G3]KAI5549680.1 ubiquitin-like family [Trichomonas vaginalis G3]|eukprot:XP_001314425.1 hypothetical protein [Trichomonas vaginalis G3]
MQAYIVKFYTNLEFYVPFEEPMTAGKVKEEMFLQLEIPTKQMTLVFNGQILPDHANLQEMGAKNGSVVYLYVPNYDNIFLQSPKRMLNEVISIFMNINIIHDETFYDAINTVKKYIESPILKSLVKIIPEIATLLEDITEYIQQVECPCDESMIEAISKANDNTFFNSQFFDTENFSFPKVETSETSLYETKCQCVIEPLQKMECSESSFSDDEEPTNLDYTPNINSNPLPFYDPDYGRIPYDL